MLTNIEKIQKIEKIEKIEDIKGLNLDQGLKNTGYSRRIYTRLLAHFLISCPDYYQQLKNTIEQNDAEQLRRITHKLYGVSELLGLDLIAQSCSLLLSNSLTTTENRSLTEQRLINLLAHLDSLYTQNQDKIQAWSKN